MDARSLVTIPVIIIALMIGASLYALAVLPSDALVPIHFNLSGKPDSFARPLIAFAILPSAATAALVISLVVSRTAKGGLARSAAAFRISLLAPLAILAVAHGLLIAYALGSQINVTRIVILATGVSLVVIGNVLGKIRQNHRFGIRAPWTLRDERVWDRTHRFGGWVFVGAGTALTLCALVIPAGPVLSIALFATIAVIAIVPSAKSYLLWRDRQNI